MKHIIYRIILIICHMVLVYSVHYNGKKFYNKRKKENKTNPKIFDLGHKYLPNISHVKYINMLINILIFFPLFIDISMFDEFLSFMIPIVILRYITTNITILPNCDKNCKDDDFNLFNMLNGHCYDKLFSGHYASATLISIFLYKKNYNKFFIGIYNLLSALLLIASRGHYSSDIIFGGYIALTSYLLNFNVNFIEKLL